jgi:hypothetical protein
MIWQRVRVALLASMVTMASALPLAGKARADHCNSGCPHAPAAGPVAPVAPVKTVKVMECVPETYTTTRTVYKQVEVEEKYTAYKCVTVPETQVRKVCTYEKVPCEEVKTRTICHKVPYCADKVCYEKHWVCKQVTCYKKKCVDNGHWECRQVEKKCHHRKKGCGDCCDPCPKYKTKKVWVPCKTYVEEPYCKTVRVCEMRPVVKKVTCYKTETRVEHYKVCTYKCVPREREETVTVCVTKKIPYEACRKVCKCVPVQEQVTCTRMVQKCVEKPISDCQPCCETKCETKCKKRKCFGW